MNLLVPDERRLLEVWDRVSTLSRPWKEVAILAATTNQTHDQCARLAIGERDRLLMLLHARTFSEQYACETHCLACDEPMGFSFGANELGLEPRTIDPESLTLTEGRIVVRLRLPNSTDIAACIGSPHPAAHLFSRCVKVQSSPGHRIGSARTSEMPASLRQSAIERLVALDPNADLMFEMACPKCGVDTKVLFDPVTAFLHQQSTTRATPQELRSGPGSALSGFLDRLIHRHTHEAIVHPLSL